MAPLLTEELALPDLETVVVTLAERVGLARKFYENLSCRQACPGTG